MDSFKIIDKDRTSVDFVIAAAKRVANVEDKVCRLDSVEILKGQVVYHFNLTPVVKVSGA